MQHKKYLALKSVLKSGKFEIKGEAIVMVASLISWFDSVEHMFIEKPIKKPEVKKIGKS